MTKLEQEIDGLIGEELSVEIARHMMVIARLKELKQLKDDAYFMRTIIHQQGLDDWKCEEAKKRMLDILYDPVTNKLRY